MNDVTTLESQPVKIAPPWNAITVPGLARSLGQLRTAEPLFREWGDAQATLGRAALSVTAGEFMARTDRLARQMIALGVTAGDRVAILALPSVDFAAAIISAMSIGATPVVMPLSQPVEALTAIAEQARAKALISGPEMDDLLVPDMGRAIAAKVFSIRAVASFAARPPAGVASLANWDEADLPPLPTELPLTRGKLVTTSVTPRGIALHERDQHQLIAEALAFATATQARPRGVFLQTLASGSSFAIVSGIVTALLIRAETRFLPVFSAAAFTDMVRHGGHQSVLILPAQIEGSLIDAQRALGDKIQSIVFAHSAGGASRLSATARLGAIRMVDATLIGEAGTYILPRTAQGRRAPLPENWRQPGARFVEGDALLLRAEIDAENGLSLAGYGAAPTISGAPARLKVTRLEGQAFELEPATPATKAA
jgi:non-ribosomal peptide synthetase component E (peptide arylation enzyme)